MLILAVIPLSAKAVDFYTVRTIDENNRDIETIIQNIPMTGVTGLTSALSGKISNLTGTSAQYMRGDGVLDTMPVIGKVFEGTTQRVGYPIFKSATVSSGTAVVYLTADGTSGGTTLCPNGVIADSVSPVVSDATASYQMSWAFTNSNKTLTVTANKLTTANILTGLLGQTQANGSVVKVTAWCY